MRMADRSGEHPLPTAESPEKEEIITLILTHTRARLLLQEMPMLRAMLEGLRNDVVGRMVELSLNENSQDNSIPRGK